MPKVRSPNRDKAFELYKQHDGKIALVDIAEQLGETDGTVRGWKSKDSWESKMNGTFHSKNTERSKQKKEKNKGTRKKSSNLSDEKNDTINTAENDNSKTDTIQNAKNRGAPKGNQNAVGNAGGLGAPVGNKYALTTGEFETIMFDDLLNETELKLFAQDIDIETELDINIRFDRVREHRMMQRIKSLENSTDGNGKKKAMSISTVTVLKSNKHGTSTATQSVNMLDVLIKHEDALNRVQSTKLRAVKELHKIRNDNARLELEQQRVKAYENKVNGVAYDEVEYDDENITFD